jgi:putative methionine-R-sulfoxide reductase with GAF domain
MFMTTKSLSSQQRQPRNATINFLANLRMGWKLALMVFVFFLGMAGITVSTYLGLQSLRYQLSNIYDFMLVPIVAINNADVALAEIQYDLLQSHSKDLTAAEQKQFLDRIAPANQTAIDIITRYDTEWVTTVSPEFSQSLREAGLLSLQEKEVAILEEYHTSFDEYLVALNNYLKSAQAGAPDVALVNEAIAHLLVARANLHQLIEVNNQYAEFSNELAQAAYRQAFATSAMVLAVALALGLLISYLIGTSISNRLGVLTRGAEAIQKGDLDQTVATPGRDEVGMLGTAFNSMAKQLKELIGALEQRVAARTKALTSVAEVSTATSTILETNKLLQMVVDLAKERFDFYHAHIYLLNEAGDTLILASGAGNVGKQMVAKGHSIPLDREQSLVARAAREKKGVTVNDVTTAPDFLPNPLLPNTHSELAVPMMVGERVIGVFDVQSQIAGRFTDADIAIQTTLASQVASAIQNARSYTELQRSQALLSDALKAARLGNWEYDFEKDLYTFSDEFYAIFRTTAEQVGGYKISSADYTKHFVHPDDAPLVGSEIQKVLDSKDRHFTTHLEHRIIFSDGETGYIAVNINVERDENGKITRWYGANQDITERRRLEELNRARARQQEAINVITQKIQSATTIESALQIAARELGHALGMKPTLVALDPVALTGKE